MMPNGKVITGNVHFRVIDLAPEPGQGRITVFTHPA